MDEIKELMREKDDPDVYDSDSVIKMTPALQNLDNFLFIVGLVLHHPHDYNVNIMAWDNVKEEVLPAHGR